MEGAAIKTKIDRACWEEKEHNWGTAAGLFLEVAYSFKDVREYEKAAEYFMRAAVTAEREEDWRKIGYLWVECGAALENRYHQPVSDLIDEVDRTSHFFPTLDRYAWNGFCAAEKLGRAYRNAAYHLEKCGANQTAYVQYKKAGDAFRKGSVLAEASRSYYRALLSYIEQHGELDSETFSTLEVVNDDLIEQNRGVYVKRRQLYYRALSAKLVEKGNHVAAARLFCKECNVSQRLAKEDRRYFTWLGYFLWKYTSNYGNSFWLWMGWSTVLFFFVFPVILRFGEVLEWKEPARAPAWFDYVYFSLATVTTGTDPSFLPTLAGKYVLMVESIIGFLMLGSLVVLLGKKVFR